ncbi:integrase core domain-containing protein [Serratia quinivorans]|uniref:integrase core domain-containing protein n=1 Tax=Serratia quinivorans TaxID=137545 RepID=UPI0039655F6B
MRISIVPIWNLAKTGKSTQNAFVECINRNYRTKILHYYLFITLSAVREITEE